MYGVSGFFGGFGGFVVDWELPRVPAADSSWSLETLRVLKAVVLVSWDSTPVTAELQLRPASTTGLDITVTPTSAVAYEDGTEDRPPAVDEWVVDHPVSSTSGCITCIIADCHRSHWL